MPIISAPTDPPSEINGMTAKPRNPSALNQPASDSVTISSVKSSMMTGSCERMARLGLFNPSSRMVRLRATGSSRQPAAALNSRKPSTSAGRITAHASISSKRSVSSAR